MHDNKLEKKQWRVYYNSDAEDMNDAYHISMSESAEEGREDDLIAKINFSEIEQGSEKKEVVIERIEIVHENFVFTTIESVGEVIVDIREKLEKSGIHLSDEVDVHYGPPPLSDNKMKVEKVEEVEEKQEVTKKQEVTEVQEVQNTESLKRTISLEKNSSEYSLFVYKDQEGNLTGSRKKIESTDGSCFVAELRVGDNKEIYKFDLHASNGIKEKITPLSVHNLLDFVQQLNYTVKDSAKIYYPYKGSQKLHPKSRIVGETYESGKRNFISCVSVKQLNESISDQCIALATAAKMKALDTQDNLKTRFFRFKDFFVANKEKQFTSGDVTFTANTLTEARNSIREALKEACDGLDSERLDVFKEKINNLIALNNEVSLHFNKDPDTGRLDTLLKKLSRNIQTVADIQKVLPAEPKRENSYEPFDNKPK